MSLDFLNEAFRKLNVLNEDTFDATDDGVKALADLSVQEDETEDDVTVIDPEAEDESELKDSYVGKVILECPICHSFVFDDRDSLEIDLTSKLANATKECPYCCEVGGFNIIGQVESFADADEPEEEEPADEVPEEEAEVADEVPEEEAEVADEVPEEDEEPVEESLNEDKCEDDECEEGLIDGDINVSLDASGSDVDVLSGRLGEECDEKCDDCDDCEDEKDDTLNEIGPIAGAALAGAGAGLLGGVIGNKLFSDLQVVENTLENAIADVINREFGIDNWTNFEFDDEEIEVEGEGDDAKTKFVGTVKILNGDDELGEFVIQDGKLVKAESEEDADDEEAEDEDEKDESVDRECDDEDAVCEKCGKKVCECDGSCKKEVKEGVCAVCKDETCETENKPYGESVCEKCGKNPCECMDEAIYVTRAEFDRRSKEFQDACAEVRKYKIKLAQTSNGDTQPDFSETPAEMKNDAEKAFARYKKALANFDTSQMIIDENLTIETSDDTTVVTDGEKEVTISDAQPKEAPVEEDTPEEASEETIVPLDDEEKKELLGDADKSEEPAEEAPAEEVDAEVDEIEEESFDRLGEKYLKKTYENVASYKTTSATARDNKIKLEGVITFKSGKTKNTAFIFEARDITASGRARFVGENATFCKGKKAFTVTGALTEGKFLSESLNYNYSAKDVDGKSTRVYGTVSNKK